VPQELEKEERKSNPKTPVIFAAILTACSVLGVAIYSFFALAGDLPLNWVVFFSLLGLLVFFNIILFILYYRRRRIFSIRTQAFMILWFGLTVWYWLFAPIYDFFTLNLNSLQLRWLAYDYFWEVPVLGGVYILLCFLVFWPIGAYADGKAKSVNPDSLYRQTLRYPVFIAVAGFLFSIIGYVFGSFQFANEAMMPRMEQIKNTLNGVMISVLIATLYYLIFDNFLGGIRAKIEDDFSLTNLKSRKFYVKFIGVIASVTLSSLALFGVLVLQSYQNLVQEDIYARMQAKIELYSPELLFIQSDEEIQGLLDQMIVDNGKVFVVENLAKLKEFDGDTQEAILTKSAGEHRDLNETIKAVVFWQEPYLDKKIVAVTYMDDYYGRAGHFVSNFSIMGALFVFLLAIGVIIFLVNIITRPVRMLAEGVSKASKDPDHYKIHLGTADEFEDLSHAFLNFVKETQKSRKDIVSLNLSLGTKVKQQTRELSQKVNELMESKAKDEALISSIGDGMIAIDVSGNIIVANESAALMLRQDFNKMAGARFTETVPWVDGNGDSIYGNKKGTFARLFLKQKVTSGMADNYYFVRTDGEKFPVAVTATPVVVDKKAVGAVVIFRDITHEKDIDQAKSEFVSLASHQLRTPLSTISWYTEMLLDEDAGKLNDNQKSYLHEVYEGNRRMIDLVNALLNVSRIELGTFAVDPEQMSIVDISKSVLAEIKPDITAKNMNIVEKYDPKVPVINADPKLIRIIFQNLLTNAVKYTPAKGTITVEIKMDKPVPTAIKEDIFITVADNGYGIPKNQQDKIFTKLFRADNIKPKVTSGTGLGLYIVKSIIEQANGKVSFESEENKGTTFKIVMPTSGMEKKLGAKGLE